jgi:tetratricopeptide (TPR) repeat protein
MTMRVWLSIALLGVLILGGCTVNDDRTTGGQPLPDFDAMWNFGDPAGTEAKFRTVLEETELHADPDYRLELETQIARTLGLQRRFEEAGALLDTIEPQLTDDMARVRIRYLLERGRVLNSSGDPAAAGPCFIEAWDLARSADEDALAVDAAHMVAIVVPPNDAIEWNKRAIAYAEQSDDPSAQRWLASLYNNLGWTRHDRGEYDEALRLFELTLVEREKTGDPQTIGIAKWCIARTLRSLGRVEEALVLQRELEAANADSDDPDGYVCEEIAECLLLLDRPGEARPYFARAHAILSSDPWLAESDPDRIARLAKLGGESGAD